VFFNDSRIKRFCADLFIMDDEDILDIMDKDEKEDSQGSSAGVQAYLDIISKRLASGADDEPAAKRAKTEKVHHVKQTP
jgi:hypothetical protein